MVKRRDREDIVTKTFLARKPDGTKELMTVKYNRRDLAGPIYILRSE